jgi:ribosomal protein L33
MFLTITNFAKKGNTLLVSVKSLASSHKMMILRDKMDEKIEFVRYDPIVDQVVVYREVKKIKTVDKPARS